MIWNDDVLFLHVPKTGGTSATFWLARNLRPKVHYTAPEKMKAHRRAKFHQGTRHESLAEAAEYFAADRRRLSEFAAIFAVMRNPYDLDVSRFFSLRELGTAGAGKAHQLAMAGDFAAFLAEAPFNGYSPPTIDRYFRIADGEMPPNMTLLTFESLADDLATHLAPYLHDEAEPRLGHLNQSDRGDWREYFDGETEALCYQRHRWFFDQGFYRRESFD